MNIRPRTDWQDPGMPVVGPSAVLERVTMLPAHYTAASSVPDDTAAYLRSIQADYTLNRGYSIGYNFAVDQAGQVWECRGFDIKCAANKEANDATVAILCLVDGAAAMSPVMVDAYTELGAHAQHVIGRSLLVVGHRDIGSTACPGDGIYHQVVTGQLDPATDPPPQPTPSPPEDDDMAPFIITNTNTGAVALVYGDGRLTGLHGPDLAGYVARFGDPIPTIGFVYDDMAAKG